jgi:segregation and condensation protein B
MEELEILPEGVSPEPQQPEQDSPQLAPPLSTPEPAEPPEAEAGDSAGTTAVSASEGVVPQSDESDVASLGTEADLARSEPSVSMEELLASSEPAPEEPVPVSVADAQLRAVLEAIVYVAEEPLTLAQISTALQQPPERVQSLLEQLVAEFDRPEHGVTIREVAGGYKMATKAEHHEAVRSFVKSLKPPLKLSLPALETLAVIAYKQPVTSPEIMEIRGVRGAGVLNTLLDRKLIAAAGRKNVIGKPILYKTTKEFLIQFGLKDLSELPSLKEFEEIRRMAFADTEAPDEGQQVSPAAAGAKPEIEAESPPQAGEAGGSACPTIEDPETAGGEVEQALPPANPDSDTTPEATASSDQDHAATEPSPASAPDSQEQES